MKRMIRSETTRHTNGQTSIRHRVILEHERAPAFDENVLTLDSIMRKSNPPHPKVHVGGSIGSGRSGA